MIFKKGQCSILRIFAATTQKETAKREKIRKYEDDLYRTLWPLILQITTVHKFFLNNFFRPLLLTPSVF